MMILDVPAHGDAAEAVAAKLKQAPGFFDSAPVVLDLQDVDDAASLRLADLVRRLRELRLVPVGIQNGGDSQNEAALGMGLCPFPSWRSGRARPHRESGAPSETDAKPPPSESAKAEAEGEAAHVATQPVRSGRRIHTRGDLVALAPVSAGAELIADGHIHVYGPLRGRALAGVGGDPNARIFCQSLEAELVSIAGAYRVREDIDDSLIGQAVQIHLDGERVHIEPLHRSGR